MKKNIFRYSQEAVSKVCCSVIARAIARSNPLINILDCFLLRSLQFAMTENETFETTSFASVLKVPFRGIVRSAEPIRGMNWKSLSLIFLIFCFMGFYSCNEDELSDESVFIDEPELNPNDYTYAFDKWLEESYLIPYNLQFRYKMQDVGADMDFNLVPTNFEKAQEMAILVKYLWFDVYGKVVDPDFLKQYGPRIIHLIGSAANNPVLGIETLGQAEGGLKVSLFKCNDLDYKNIEVMNEYYFKTMHHEFAHILHQQKTYPKDFETYTAGFYDPAGWQNRTISEAASLGCASPYGSSQSREDFVEIIACYIVKTDNWWNDLYAMASKPGIDQSGQTVNDPIDGKAVLEAKIEICRKWLKDSWGIDMEALRAEVQERQLHIEEVMNETYW